MKSLFLLVFLFIFGCREKNPLEKLLSSVESFSREEKARCDYLHKPDISAKKFKFNKNNNKITGSLFVPNEIKGLPVVIWFQGYDGEHFTNYCKGMKWEGVLAAKGYAVFTINYPGLGGSEGIDEYGGSEVKAFLKLIETLEEKGGRDLFLVGFSRGAMMALRSIQEGVKAKAVALVGGVYDQQLQLEFDGYRNAADKHWLKRKFSLSEKGLKKISAIHWIEEINVPTLLMYGANDKVVSPENSIRFAKKMKKLKKRVKIIACEKGGHHCVRNSGNHEERDKLFDKVDKWFRQYKS